MGICKILNELKKNSWSDSSRSQCGTGRYLLIKYMNRKRSFFINRMTKDFNSPPYACRSEIGK